MKKRGKTIILVITLFLIVSLFFLYYLFFKNKQTLSIAEKQWIDNNKNDVIDISILNSVPAFTYNGNGAVFDFLNYISKETNLSFNPSAFKPSDTDLNNYSFTVKDSIKENDLLIHKDNYALVNLDGSIVSNLDNISNNKIAVLKDDINKFRKYFNDTNSFLEYDDYETLLSKVESDNINSIILLKTNLMEYISKNNLNISYQFASETKNYVLSLNGDNILNSIITKYYNEWINNYFTDSYNTHLLSDYYTFNNVSTMQQTELKSKTYIYGFVEDGIYDRLSKGNLVGINNNILKAFTNFSKTAIEYKKYDSIKNLVMDYNNGKIDIIFNDESIKINKDSYYTHSYVDSKIVVLSPFGKNVNINSKEGLRDYDVITVKDSKIAEYLSANNIPYKGYKNISSLLNNLKKDNIVVLDLKDYEYYKTRQFKNYKIDAIIDDINYNYIINNSIKNTTFTTLFDFYTSYTGTNYIIEKDYSSIAYKTVDYFYAMICALFMVVILFVVMIINKIRLFIIKYRDNHRSKLTKEEKMKYIDQLTSLKNRAYLNSKVEKWDESEVYPQCIIVVDLNNIAYINDNYGREEGDKIILQAANILITSQLPNTEIIRTDGNEFLVYLVGYPEKTVIAYMRKLNRAFKNLDHGFGAAIGYSMITDAIKTFDDAVNEATIDMRNNKDGN